MSTRERTDAGLRALKALITSLLALAQEVSRGYAWVALLPQARWGALLAALTWLDNPGAASQGLAGAVAAWCGAGAAGAQTEERPIAVFNGLLLGLLLAHTGWASTAHGLLLVTAAALLGAVTTLLGTAWLRRSGLGLYSAPFAVLALAWGILQTQTIPTDPMATTCPGDPTAWLSSLGPSVGALLFLQSAWAGWAMLLVLTLASPYYLWLLLCAVGISTGVAVVAGGTTETISCSMHANALLTMLLVGGLMAAPGLISWLYAAVAAALAAMLAWAFASATHLPGYSLPFVLASWMALAAMRRHPKLQHLLHPLPQLPEQAAARRTMAASHAAYRRAPCLAVPFNGTWTVSQDIDGPHTHVGALRYALDFIRVVDGASFRGLGAIPADFHAFGEAVYAPAAGEVVQAIGHCADNAIGEVDTVNRWGNHVVIRMDNGLYVLLAHLRQGSLYVAPGSWVHQGQIIGHCGNSGRSPQPHLHLHVQTAPYPGSPTTRFHLTNLWLDSGQPLAHHALRALPVSGQAVCGASLPSIYPLALLPGRGLRFRTSVDGQGSVDWTLLCSLTPEGRWQLRSSAGATCIVTVHDAMFCCSERNAAPDILFDAWTLACANVSTSADVLHWELRNQEARHSVQGTHRALSFLGLPAMTVLHSTGHRTWDASRASWIQTATHRAAWGARDVQTQAHIPVRLGAANVEASWGTHRLTLTAVSLIQHGDVGISGWEKEINLAG
ncbi:urea transporter [Curvibacter sp. APW13]|uniref:urea transporter n=1 Tax=Curvibacter sp. APW13 TaxID=3077236 RepID=UPI0028DE699E|nr:urea transporter [Curvibacter sp. APW13]MDT8991949.1 urea transporter [Curvibacter sp. APW13]